MICSIIIPTFNHAEYLAGAIDSALAQTLPCEVIVVDDGSTDGTAALLASYGNRIKAIYCLHSGVAHARNVGLDHAGGDFVMFLDADDTIADRKVEFQVLELASHDRAGWAICDVEIVGSGRRTTASERYRYADKDLSGWIQPLLVAGNFIPVMSPLVRRELLTGIRFHEDRRPEDWHFWHAVAGVARCRYVPRVLATYRKRPGGRNVTTTKRHPADTPGVELPLRLNLGCGTPDTDSWHPLPGFVNLDRSLGWRFEDGLGDFVDGSVAGITTSHALMYVALADWPQAFAEFARVLRPGGVLRITGDDTSDPRSARYGGWRGSEPAVTLTDPRMVRRYLENAGFTAHDVTAHATRFQDRSLCQAHHGQPPDVFFIEGVRECSLLLSPHSDDEALFAAFTIIRHRPQVVVCFPSSGDYGDTAVRTEESRRAVATLGGGPVHQWQSGVDLEWQMRELDARLRPSRVWAPSGATSHPDHLAVAWRAERVFGSRLTKYHTYKDGEKVRGGVPVAFEQSWVERKRSALACYRSQLDHPRARRFFEDDLAEYME